nr:helix-turn-helix transcriptional regulator [Stenotrophomonas maltophilia]
MRGLSQRALGALVDKDQDKNRGAVLINRYERERNQADMTKAAELAKALDVPVAYLFAEDDDLAAAILAFAKLPSAERQRMREELERLAGKQRR